MYITLKIKFEKKIFKIDELIRGNGMLDIEKINPYLHRDNNPGL